MMVLECRPRNHDWLIDLLNGPITTFVVFLGVVGNIYSALLIFQRRMNSSMKVSLMALALWDFIFLIVAFVYFAIKSNANLLHTQANIISVYATFINGIFLFVQIVAVNFNFFLLY